MKQLHGIHHAHERLHARRPVSHLCRKPEQYGFRHVTINAKDYFCAPPEWDDPAGGPRTVR